MSKEKIKELFHSEATSDIILFVGLCLLLMLLILPLVRESKYAELITCCSVLYPFAGKFFKV